MQLLIYLSDATEVGTYPCLVVGMGGHAHHATDTHILQGRNNRLYLGSLYLFRQEAEFRFLLRHMHLEQHIHHPLNLGGGTVHLFKVGQAVHSMYHAHKGDVVLKLFSLQVAYEVPLDVLRQSNGFVS